MATPETYLERVLAIFHDVTALFRPATKLAWYDSLTWLLAAPAEMIPSDTLARIV
jgi:hypothetical protein